jgi:hypothetical protein
VSFTQVRGREFLGSPWQKRRNDLPSSAGPQTNPQIPDLPREEPENAARPAPAIKGEGVLFLQISRR